MKLLFIRHAEAVERDEWDGDDLSRPLTKRGIKQAKQAGRELLRLAATPDLILASEAVRAQRTAEILADVLNVKRRLATASVLNPGCNPAAARSLARKHMAQETVAFVGHEPDFSAIIASFIGDGSAQIRMKKCAMALVDLDLRGRGELCWLIQPD